MAIIREQEISTKSILNTAYKMCIAARTAPKAKGRSTLEINILTGDEINILAKKMYEIGEESNTDFFKRDSGNMNFAEAIVLIGTEIKSLGLNEICQYCGFKNCVEKDKHPSIPCAFNTGDLHLAIGSAVSVASLDYVDNRIMFSIGKAAIKLGLFQKNIKIAMGIPLASLSKNPFFDRN